MARIQVETGKHPLVSLISTLLSRWSFHNLLVWLLLYLVAGPFLHGDHARILLSVSMSMVLFFAAYAVNTRGTMYRYVMGIMTLTLVLFWLDIFRVVEFTRLASRLIMAAYIALIIYMFAKYIMQARKVTSRLINAALCLYLLMGTFWGIAYDLLDIAVPGSYAGILLENASNFTERFKHFQYFSFVTLTTLGYGDILPQTEGAAALCQAEAIIGQFFMAVLVARLVGIQVSQQFADKTETDKGDTGQ